MLKNKETKFDQTLRSYKPIANQPKKIKLNSNKSSKKLDIQKIATTSDFLHHFEKNTVDADIQNIYDMYVER